MYGTDPVNNEGVNAGRLLKAPSAEKGIDAERVAKVAKQRIAPPMGMYRSKKYIKSYYKKQAEASPSLKVFEPAISSKVATWRSVRVVEAG